MLEFIAKIFFCTKEAGAAEKIREPLKQMQCAMFVDVHLKFYFMKLQNN